MIKKIKNILAIWGAGGLFGVFVMSSIGFCIIAGIIGYYDEFFSAIFYGNRKGADELFGKLWPQTIPLIILSVLAIAAIVFAIIHAVRTAEDKPQKSAIGITSMLLTIAAHIFMMVLIIVLLACDAKSSSRSSSDIGLVLVTMKSMYIPTWSLVIALVTSIINTLISAGAFIVALLPENGSVSALSFEQPVAQPAVQPMGTVPVEQPVIAPAAAPVETMTQSEPNASVAPVTPAAPVEQPVSPVEPIAPEQPMTPQF